MRVMGAHGDPAANLIYRRKCGIQGLGFRVQGLNSFS